MINKTNTKAVVPEYKYKQKHPPKHESITKISTNKKQNPKKGI